MKAQAVEVDGVMMLVCQQYARCTNTTLTVLPHPILGPVPCCTRCANRFGNVADLQPIEIKVES